MVCLGCFNHNWFLFVTECNTQKVVDLFVKSIRANDIKARKCESSEGFVAGKCDSNEEVVFGENVSRNTQGNYFLHL